MVGGIMLRIEEINDFQLIERNSFVSIEPWLDSKECIFITGSRQVGKTFLLYFIIQHLFKKKSVNNNAIAFLDMENPTDFLAANGLPEELLQYLALNGIKAEINKKLYLFIDEIHLLDNPAKLIKLLVDHHRNIKLFVTGSSSTAIRKKFTDSMAGRKLEFHLTPLSFSEFLRFNNEKNLSSEIITNIHDIFEKKIPSESLKKIIIQKADMFFQRYSVFGGYPDIALINESLPATRKLISIYNDYVRKDIASLFSVEHLTDFTKLTRILAAQAGGILNLSNIASDCGIDRKTLSKYIEIIEQTFIIKRLQPFAKNIKQRLVKSPKSYFLDSGMRNCALQNFISLDKRTDCGEIIENFIFQCLNRESELSQMDNLFFWRTSNGSEVDFIFNDIAIEVKSGNFDSNPPRALLECMETLKFNKAIIFNKSVYEKRTVEDMTIIYFPYCLFGA